MSYPFDLGTYSRKISTDSPEAQQWFDRGLNWLWGFNHNEAAVCFQKVLEFDPDCAMAYWGIAYAGGLNYNVFWEHFTPANLAQMLGERRRLIGLAKARMSGASAVEQAIIGSLERRYPSDVAAPDLYAWSADYADALRAVYLKFDQYADVVALFADAMLNRHPWKLWNLRTGEPTPGTDTIECQQVLERAIDRIRSTGEELHPGIWHFYVHLMEMSATPARALTAADELRHLVPDAGHLRHMPTHIDVQCGNYHDVVLWNHIGIQKDMKYWRHAGPMNMYSLARAHNYHFKLYGAMLLGQLGPALDAVAGIEHTMPDRLVRMESPPMADRVESYLAMKTHALVRFGRWRELIAEPLPQDPAFYCTTTAFIHYGKAIAHAALKDHASAARSRADFEAACATVPATRRRHTTTVHSMLEIARAVMVGEIEYHQGNYDAAFTQLRRAVQLDDALPYDEPWGWMMPTRHPLGALLLEQGHLEEAAAVYEADLGLNDSVIRANRHPNNVWALIGLHRCYIEQGRHAEAGLIKPMLDIALGRADRSIASSCFCSLVADSADAAAATRAACCDGESPTVAPGRQPQAMACCGANAIAAAPAHPLP